MESNFRQKQQEEQETITSSDTKTEVEFTTPEAAIQHDRAQNLPPRKIAERLNKSLAAEPKRGASFWTKLGFKK
jgi:hypothetical protein